MMAGVGHSAVCANCQSPLRLIAQVNSSDVAKKILMAMHLPALVPELHPARPPPARDRERRVEYWLN
jgi:hypothetical protein